MMAYQQDNVDRLVIAWNRLLGLFGTTIPNLTNRLRAVRQKAAGGDGGPVAS